MDASQLSDKQFELLLERLDRLADEVARVNRRLETADGFERVAAELRTLSESLQTLAYAALGQAGPSVRRRRSA